jgi:hypothetical protein
LEVPKHGRCSETFATLFAALRCLSRSHLFSDHFWEACMVAPLIKLLAVLFFLFILVLQDWHCVGCDTMINVCFLH